MVNSCSDVNKCLDELSAYEDEYKNLNDIAYQELHENYMSSVGEVQIVNAIKYVKKGKETENNIPKRIYKLFSNSLAIPISIMFTNIFLSGIVPDSFKKADVTPLYKGKGKRTSSSSFRAIFSLSFLVKLFEKILYDKLLYYTHASLDQNQHGFRKFKSCETAVSTFTQDMYGNLDKKKGKGIAIYIDFSKAFDSIDQSMFIMKLMKNFSYKIPPLLIKLLISYFSKSSFRIINGDHQLEYFNISAGVPPG